MPEPEAGFCPKANGIPTQDFKEEEIMYRNIPNELKNIQIIREMALKYDV